MRLSRHHTQHQRFFTKVEFTDDCWVWMSSKNEKGYGIFYIGMGHVKASRWSYEQLVGPLTPGLEIDHLCRNRACVRPEHLELVTHAENVARTRGLPHNYPRKGR